MIFLPLSSSFGEDKKKTEGEKNIDQSNENLFSVTLKWNKDRWLKEQRSMGLPNKRFKRLISSISSRHAAFFSLFLSLNRFNRNTMLIKHIKHWNGWNTSLKKTSIPMDIWTMFINNWEMEENFASNRSIQSFLFLSSSMFRLINVLLPNSIPKINSGSTFHSIFSREHCSSLGENTFKLMENIARFTQSARTYGLSDAETFQTVDLFEKMNLHQVILCIFALGRKVFSNSSRWYIHCSMDI